METEKTVNEEINGSAPDETKQAIGDIKSAIDELKDNITPIKNMQEEIDKIKMTISLIQRDITSTFMQPELRNIEAGGPIINTIDELLWGKKE